MKSTALAILMASATTIPLALPAEAEDNPWMVRGRVLAVLPDESASLSVGGDTLPGDVDIGDQYVPELDITYFFNDNLAAELILAVTPHDVDATGITIPAAELEDATVGLGDVWLLPPTLTLQYHFRNDTAFKPYIGAGVNATHFFNEDEGDVADSVDYDASFGFALQAGVDYDLDGVPGGWAFNADVKKVWINTEADVDLTSALGGALGAEEVIVNADVDIDPVIVGLGFGYKF
ncbi:MAG: outer membrane beta-barrel protein [Alphaproteobacteria bacterium]|jgi:outer membrane protein|nr:outer membrane beta-barrel protein [Alphaproteobacteria bacterium]